MKNKDPSITWEISRFFILYPKNQEQWLVKLFIRQQTWINQMCFRVEGRKSRVLSTMHPPLHAISMCPKVDAKWENCFIWSPYFFHKVLRCWCLNDCTLHYIVHHKFIYLYIYITCTNPESILTCAIGNFQSDFG